MTTVRWLAKAWVSLGELVSSTSLSPQSTFVR